MSKSTLSKLSSGNGKMPVKTKQHDGPAFTTTFPNLYELMTAEEFGGQERDTSTVSIFVKDQELRVFIGCPSEGKRLFVTIPDYRALFKCVEDALNDPDANWLPMKKYKKSRK